MSVEEKKLHVLIVDEGARVIVLINKEMAHELRGAKLHAAKVLFDLSTKAKPPARTPMRDETDTERRARFHKEERSSQSVYPDKDAIATMQEEADVLVPAPERHHVMPEGITRTCIGRKLYLEDRHPFLHNSAHKVLRAVAAYGKPVIMRDLREWMHRNTPPGVDRVPDGTITSQLYDLSLKGYLWKQKNSAKHALIYTITDKGEDALTQPEQPALDLRPMEGSA